MTIPPDPEGMNDRRSEWAAEALSRFESVTSAPPEDLLTDLLKNLMHWCDRNDVDFNDELAAARLHYEAETDA